MLRKLFFAFTITAIVLGACGPAAPEPTSTPTKTPEPTSTPAPELEAVLDDSIDPDKFPGDGNIIIHFNQPMDPDSVDPPLALIPRFSGEYRWSNALHINNMKGY